MRLHSAEHPEINICMVPDLHVQYTKSLDCFPVRRKQVTVPEEDRSTAPYKNISSLGEHFSSSTHSQTHKQSENQPSDV